MKAFDNAAFGVKIIELRKESGLSQAKLAEMAGVTQQTLSRYEKGERQASLDFVITVADIFRVSADYLLGLSDVKSTEQDIKTACKVLGLSQKAVENIKKIAGMYDTALLKKSGFVVNPTSQQHDERNDKIIKRFFESEELGGVVMSILYAASYEQAYKNEMNEAADLIEKLKYSEDKMNSDSMRLSRIYTHRFDRIARTYTFDAYGYIDTFVKRMVEEQEEDAQNGKHHEAQE